MSRRLLDPLERSLEIIFGLIMVLTFTGTMRVAEADLDVGTVLWAAIGCNLAWGLIDAVMYLLTTFMTRARGLRTLTAIRAAEQPDAARRLIVDALPTVVSAVFTSGEIETLRQRLKAQPQPAALSRLSGSDYLAATGVFLLVFLSTFPVVVPFLIIHDTALALLASNTVAVVILYFSGWSLGTYAGRPGWRTGTGMVVIGIGLVAITVALGG